MPFKFFNSAPDDRIILNTQNPLHRAVCAYLKAIEAANYEPTVVDGNWNDNQISEYIERLLANCPTYFDDWDVPEAIETSVSCIAHLAASLACFKDVVELPPNQQLYQMEKTGAFPLVHAGMPGPCLIYLQALLTSPGYDAISKIMMLGELIDSLNKKQNSYGLLDSVVLPIVIENWFSLLHSFTPKQQEVLRGKAANYLDLKEECYNSLIMENATFIDKCIINVWEQLHINYNLNATSELCRRSM